MIVLEFKLKGKASQFVAVDNAIRTIQFIRNKTIRYWLDNKGVGRKQLMRNNTALRAEFSWCKALNAHACQAAVDRAWFSINRFYANCKKQVKGKKGYPKFKKNVRSVEYKTSGWTLSDGRRHITFTDGNGIGRLKLIGTRDLNFYASRSSE
jgi:putative transposase